MPDQYVKIGVEIDKQAQTAVNASIDAMGARFVSLSDKLGKASIQAQQAGNAFKRGFGTVTDEIENAGKALNKAQEGSASFFRGISGLTGGTLGEIAQTARQIEEVTQGFKKMTSQGIGPLLQSLGPTVLAAGALSLGIAGVTAIINAFNQEVEKQKVQLEKELALRQELRELTRSATTDEAKAKRDVAQQAVDDIKLEIEGYKKRRIELLAGGFNADTIARQNANKALLEEQEAALIIAEEKLAGYNTALKNNAFAAKDAVKGIDDYIKAAQKGAGLLGMSSAQLTKHLEDLKQQEAILIEAEKRAHDQLMAGNEAMRAKDAELVQKLKDLRDEMDSVTKATGGSSESILEHVKAQEAATEASKKATEAYKALQKAEDDAFQKIQQRNKDLVTAQGKYEADVEAIQSASLQKRADIEQKYADTLVSIAQDATQKAQDRLDKLNQDRAEKTLALARDEENATIQAGIAELDIKIKAQREERDALQDHLRTLENIRANAKLREQADLLNRNFLGVLQSRLQMAGDITGENQKFTQGQQDRAQATQDQLSDLQRAQAQERAARLKAYQQQLADAQAAYQRETAQASKDRVLAMARAQIDRNKALEEEDRSRVQSLAILRKQHVQELQDIYDFGVRKLKLERDLLQAALNMIAQVNVGARPSVRGKPTQTVQPFADGGDIAAGQWGLVQEGLNREAFNGIPFPSSGAGMFYPMQGGTISHVSNSTTNAPVQATINIPGAQNPNEIARVVVDVLKKVQKV